MNKGNFQYEMIDFYHYYDIDLYPADFIEYTSYDHQVCIIVLSISKKKLSQESRKGFLVIMLFRFNEVILCYFSYIHKFHKHFTTLLTIFLYNDKNIL